jgi:hypothetical protein
VSSPSIVLCYTLIRPRQVKYHVSSITSQTKTTSPFLVTLCRKALRANYPKC